MQWPCDLPDPIRRSILARWSAAKGAGSVNERAKALASLGQLQRDYELSDVALNFIAESELQRPSEDAPESVQNVVLLFIELIRRVGIITSLENALVSTFWSLHTYFFREFTYTPRLVQQSRETGCGKTALLELLEPLVANGHKADDVTPASIYRRLKRQDTTYLLDEVEHSDILSEKRFKALFNMGYQGGLVEVAGKEFPVHFPLALALVVSRSAYLTPQATRRSIILEATKSKEGRNRVKANSGPIAIVREEIHKWAETFKPPPPGETPLPPRLTTEACNNFEPLVAMADSVGFDATARALALAMDHHSENPVDRLMLDCLQTFQRYGGPFFTPELLKLLHELPDSFWDEYRGVSGLAAPHKLTRTELYDLFAVKQIKSKTVWKGRRTQGQKGESAKGFERKQFEPVWAAMGVTLSQVSKIISLPRHEHRHTDSTNPETAEEE